MTDDRQWPPRLWVFRMDDIECWAGESLEACVAEGRRQCGDDCYPDDPDEQGPVTFDAMFRLTVRDDDGTERTFAAELQRRIDAGEKFPQHFCASEW